MNCLPRISTLAAAWLPIAVLLGCGGESQGPNLVNATGLVSLNGSPLSGAVVTLHPVGTTRGNGASARTDSAGKFELKSPPRGKGAVPGEYKVVISKLVLPDGTDFPENSPVAPMDSNAKEQLPPEYSDFEQTTLTAKVPEAGGELKFTLVTQ
jgi:hypothetical protein